MDKEAAITLPLDIVEELIRLAREQTGGKPQAAGDGPPVELPETTVQSLVNAQTPNPYGLSLTGVEAVELAEREVAEVRRLIGELK